MQALSKKVKSSNRQCPLYATPTEVIQNCIIDMEQFTSCVKFWAKQSTSYKYPLFVKNDRMNYAKYGASAKTGIKALTVGNIDTEVWQTVNAHKNNLYTTKHGKKISKLEPHGFAGQFVLDLDESGFSNIDEIYNYLKENTLPLPLQITQTGKRSFHLVYRMETDRDPRNGISVIEVILFACYLFQIDAKDQSTDSLLSQLYNYGIDRSYIYQHPSTHKYRVPGSMKIKERERFTCIGKAYRYTPMKQSELWDMFSSHPSIDLLKEKNGITSSVVSIDVAKEQEEEHFIREVKRENIQDIEITEEIAAKEQLIISAIENDYWKEYIPIFIEKFSTVMSKKYAKKYAEWICKNLTFLKRGELYISQLRVAKELDIVQTTVSRHLKALIDGGFLKILGSYVKGKIPRKYGMGDLIQELFQTKVYEKLEEEYVAGETNDQMLTDIRILVHSGVETADIIKIVRMKMESRPYKKQRSEKDIKRAVGSWLNKTTKTIPDKSRLDLNRLYKTMRVV